jgi:thiosulfate/3-mercaptopyruvate sulfurtransferase
MNLIVSIEWLHQNLNDKDLIVLDASLQSTAEGKRSEHHLKTIPGARYFDLEGAFSDKNSPFSNTLPTEEQFETESRKLGINKTSKIIVFDNIGIYSSPRVWWMFKIMGHYNISVLNGGLPEWINKGFPTDNRKTENYKLGNIKATIQKQFVKSYKDVLDNLRTKSFNIIDARSEGRFKGVDKEPRKHLKSGHIPDSINIPYGKVLDNGKFKTELELKKIFDKKCTGEKDLVFSCGSGLTACIVMMASEIIHKKSKNIYDGSWSEWAELQNLKENVV